LSDVTNSMRRIYFIVIFWSVIAGANIGFGFYFLPLRMAILITSFVLFFQIVVFYVNSYVLFPRYFSLDKTARFILITAVFILIITLIQSLADYMYISKLILKHVPRGKPRFSMIFMRSLFWLVFIDMISTVYMMQDRIRTQAEHTQHLISEKLDTELKLLKAQINPHFIFNTLNNIYSLTYMKSDKAPESILKLSQMMRYVIEDCENERVTLNSEIEYIENYIAFQQMKSPDEQNISFDYSRAEKDVLIPPMLFIPFIENSFKYSKIEEFPDAFIEIVLSADQTSILFDIRNSIADSRHQQPGAGTGIENVKKRLEIIFPQKHTLQILREEDLFQVHLRLLIK